MDSFQDANGATQTRLNLVQRSFEALSRPQSSRTEGSATGTSAVEEPMSGLGAS